MSPQLSKSVANRIETIIWYELRASNDFITRRDFRTMLAFQTQTM